MDSFFLCLHKQNVFIFLSLYILIHASIKRSKKKQAAVGCCYGDSGGSSLDTGEVVCLRRGSAGEGGREGGGRGGGREGELITPLTQTAV